MHVPFRFQEVSHGIPIGHPAIQLNLPKDFLQSLSLVEQKRKLHVVDCDPKEHTHADGRSGHGPHAICIPYPMRCMAHSITRLLDALWNGASEHACPQRPNPWSILPWWTLVFCPFVLNPQNTQSKCFLVVCDFIFLQKKLTHLQGGIEHRAGIRDKRPFGPAFPGFFRIFSV